MARGGRASGVSRASLASSEPRASLASSGPGPPLASSGPLAPPAPPASRPSRVDTSAHVEGGDQLARGDRGRAALGDADRGGDAREPDRLLDRDARAEGEGEGRDDGVAGARDV